VTRALATVMLAAVLANVGAAGAQQSSAYSITYGLTPIHAKHVTQRTVALKVSGAITVTFHADTATGCGALSGCAYHGTLVWSPEGAGELLETAYTLGGRRHVERALVFGPENSQGGPATYADVFRDGSSGVSGECVDEQPSSPFLEGRRAGATFTFPLSGATAATRCAGPLPSDLAGALPSVVLPGTPHRGLRVDASGTKTFAEHGFAGTLSSTMVITVGATRALPQSVAPPKGVPPVRYRRFRIVTVPIVGARAAGTLTARVTGTANTDVCVLLDACGVTGTLTVTPSPGTPSGNLSAQAPASRPLRDVLTALGLATGGNIRGIGVLGEITWPEKGTTTADVVQGATCRDTAPLVGGTAILIALSGRTDAEYVPAGGPGGPAPRTRCPGPLLWQSAPAVTGTFSQRILGRHTFSLVLSPRPASSDDGYDAHTSGHVTLTFRRGKPRVQIQTQPTF
jgi:hypothetical protein